ncbi:hypothetical protein ACLOJK_036467 [Asimina triloba]
MVRFLKIHCCHVMWVNARFWGLSVGCCLDVLGIVIVGSMVTAFVLTRGIVVGPRAGRELLADGVDGGVVDCGPWLWMMLELGKMGDDCLVRSWPSDRRLTTDGGRGEQTDAGCGWADLLVGVGRWCCRCLAVDGLAGVGEEDEYWRDRIEHVILVILGGLDQPSAHLAVACRRQPLLPAMEMTMEHHTSAPVVY